MGANKQDPQTIPTGTERKREKGRYIQGKMQKQRCMPSETQTQRHPLQRYSEMDLGGSQGEIHKNTDRMGHRVSKTCRSSKKETHKWRHREIYTTDRKKHASGQRDTHGGVKRANKQQDIIGQSLIHPEPFRHKAKW